MRLMFARALTVALAVVVGAAAMAFPKLVIDEAVPEASPPAIADRAPRAVTVIRVAPAEALSRPRPPAPRRTVAKPRPAASTPTSSSVIASAPLPVPTAPSRPTPPATSPLPMKPRPAPPCRRPAPAALPDPDADADPRADADADAGRTHPCPSRGAGCRRPWALARHGRRAADRPAAAGRRAAEGAEGADEARQVVPVRLVRRRVGADRPCRLRGSRRRPAGPAGRGRQRQPGRRSELVADGRPAACANIPPCPASAPRVRSVSRYGAFYLWRRLPPAQRRQVMLAARTHGPKIAAAVLAARRKPKP